MTNNASDHVRFLFDPVCPWSWRASRWIRSAALVRPLTIEWRVLSLAALNRTSAAERQPALRVLWHVQQQFGNTALDQLYAALGEGVHQQRRSLADRATLHAALRAADLDPQLINMADAAHLDDQIDGQAQQAKLSGAIGVPTLFVNTNPHAYFGPVIDQIPDGEEAGELWDHVHWMADHPYVYELKRSRA